MSAKKPSSRPGITRRRLLRGGAAAAALAALPGRAVDASCAPSEGGVIRKGRIRQSIVQWCFSEHWSLEETCRVARRLGVRSVELVAPEDWPTLKKHGLTCAIAPNGMPDPPFVRGFNNPRYRAELLAATRRTIDACAEFGVPTVIAFNGFKWRDAADPSSGEIDLEEGARNCAGGLKEACLHAEKKGVTIAIEMLNTRATDHPMKGHPGYQGDHTDYVLDIVRKVGSSRLKLLFDIYHVQIMDGDLIRRIHQCSELIGHVHTAGNPGRGELDSAQEINFPAVMRALLEVGYEGWVGQEFIPTRDPCKGLAEACALCDV